MSMLRRSLKRLALRTLTAPLPYRALRARLDLPGTVTVLCYHTLGPDEETFNAWTVLRAGDFARHVEILRRDYDIVSLDDAFMPAATSRPRAVITFDDGDIGLYTHLLPFVTREKVPVTVYVATGQIEAGRPYWFDRVMNALQAPGEFTIDLGADGPGRWTVGPATGEARWLVISDILETLKQVDPAAREDLAAKIVTQAPEGRENFTALAPMSVDQLQELAENPSITIGAHSRCHNLLDRIPPEQARESVQRSRTDLESWTGAEVHHFAYPNGNHDAGVRAIVAGCGFRSATALSPGLWRKETDPFALPRMAIGRYDGDPARFRWRLLGR